MGGRDRPAQGRRLVWTAANPQQHFRPPLLTPHLSPKSRQALGPSPGSAGDSAPPAVGERLGAALSAPPLVPRPLAVLPPGPGVRGRNLNPWEQRVSQLPEGKIKKVRELVANFRFPRALRAPDNRVPAPAQPQEAGSHRGLPVALEVSSPRSGSSAAPCRQGEWRGGPRLDPVPGLRGPQPPSQRRIQ